MSQKNQTNLNPLILSGLALVLLRRQLIGSHDAEYNVSGL